MFVAILVVGWMAFAVAMSMLRTPRRPWDVEYVPGGDAEHIQRRHHQLVATPIGEMPAHQRGRIDGRVAARGRLLKAPLTGRSCVYYAIEVAQISHPSLPSLICEERIGVPFTLADPSGEASVDPSSAELALVFDHIERPSSDDPMNAAHDAVLARHGIGSQEVGTTRLQLSEAVIAPGDQLSVIGAGPREPDTTPSCDSPYRASATTRLHVVGSERDPLSILQAPRSAGERCPN